MLDIDYASIIAELGSQKLASLAGSVIYATEMEDFEYGPWIGNQSEAENSLQWVCSTLEINILIDSRSRAV